MENVEHDTAQQERDNHVIRRVVITIFVVLTLAAIVITFFYGLPRSK
jgi:hypothetical protein